MTTPSTNAVQAIVQDYFDRSPAFAAQTLENTDRDEALEILRLLPLKAARQAFGAVSISFAAELLNGEDTAFLVDLARDMPPERSASVLLLLTAEARIAFLDRLSEKRKRAIQEYLTFPEDSVGRLMSTAFTSMPESTTMKAARDQLRARSKKNIPSSYLYVTDDEKRLKCVVNMRSLLIAGGTDTLAFIMVQDVFCLHAFVSRQDAAAEIGKRGDFAAPVVDSENRLLGVIRAESLFEGVRE